jgi:lycopene cyclase domain-containing protein
MTYAQFLMVFLAFPIVLLVFATRRYLTRSRWGMLFLMSFIALVYTTPWDNYLVASGVWWYDADLVLGIVFGWVPLEEYAFFVLEPLLTGLWVLYAGGRFPPSRAPFVGNPALRQRAVFITGLVWLGAVAILLAGWQPGTYLGLEIGWMVPPMVLQMAFGADIIWHHRRAVTFSIVSASIYYSLADALAIGLGIWTIDPAQSLRVYLGGILPVEELIFFILTNTLIVFGMTLMLARESQDRFCLFLQATRGRARAIRLGRSRE